LAAARGNDKPDHLLTRAPVNIGAVACIADFAATQSIWFLRRAPPVATILAGFPRLVRAV